MLSHLSPEHTSEAYYEAAAKKAMEPILASANPQYHGSTSAAAASRDAGIGQSRIAAGKSDYLTNSQVTQRRN